MKFRNESSARKSNAASRKFSNPKQSVTANRRNVPVRRIGHLGETEFNLNPLADPASHFKCKPTANDEFYTPPYAIDMLLPYLPTNKVIWEAAWGRGHLGTYLRSRGFKVAGRPGLDFFAVHVDCDLIVTNPPFSLKNEFLQRLYEINKPFALLLPVDALVGLERYPLFTEFGLQLLIPKRRINYISDNPAHKSANFNSAWFCWKLLPGDLLFAAA